LLLRSLSCQARHVLSSDSSICLAVASYDNNTFIIRQNPCVSFEAPFLYLFLGNNTALLYDSGAV
jgi:hypothetical protein